MDYGEFLSELLRKTDIVKLVSRYVPLKKKGGTYWGCCPFHHEKTPSFTVNEDRGLYHCFGCKAGGNAITFVSEIESVDRGEAIRILAKEAGMEVPQSGNKNKKDYTELNHKREKLYKLMRAAARHYHENLYTPQAKTVRDYLTKREIGENLIKRFGLGYSINGSEMIEYLKTQGFTLTEIKEAGIAAQKADEYYDVFYGRLIIPIINNMGEVVSFGGRVLTANPDFAKYRNGSQTIIFDKSRNIYAANLLKKKKQNSGLTHIIMTEGYMDVISLHKAGFDSAVASMGTALTNTQAKLLKNYCDKIYISYDGDSAGQTATLRGLDILADAGFNVKVVQLPEGLDPDDVIKKHGAAFYENLLTEALPLPQFKIEVLARKYDLSRSDEKAKFAVEAAKVIKTLDNPIEKEEYLGTVHRLTGYTMESLYKQLDFSPEPEREFQPEPVAAKPQSQIDPSIKFVLASILAQKEYCDYSLDIFPYLSSDLHRRVYEWGLNGFKQGAKQGLAEFYENTPPEDHSQLSELLEYEFIDGDGADKFAKCVKTLRQNAIKQQKDELVRQYAATKDPNILRQIGELDKKLTALRKGEED